jgi:hypothetical protein
LSFRGSWLIYKAGSTPMTEITARATPRPLLAAGAAVIALALGGTVLLWAHYGTTIFFETIRAGFAACFG